ncbi:M3 family metallopeptidase [Planococcus sp. MB-3u-03]|uniref:M3 family metallopeptidase n=1 Tax=Planococcus sp. MB-3u-03 TaxID=2058136 RepID=UPI001E55BBA0|nr:M3 family metallopeptidase [Planococcus sp. MB-3u-03]
MTNLLTLTHELGHAFHNHAMKPVNPLNRKYGMTTAETASTFAEMIVLDAAIDQTENTEEKLFLWTKNQAQCHELYESSCSISL